MEVNLISYTGPSSHLIEEANQNLDIQQLVAYCARVSNPSNQTAENRNDEKLVNYLIKNRHWSPFEMVNVCLEIKTTRDIARQILRHRSFSFQEFCVTEDTLVTTYQKNGKTKKVSIKDLYKRYKNNQYWNMSDNLIKSYCQDRKIFEIDKIFRVYETGIKPVYEVLLDNGKKIKTTHEHEFFVYNKGFKKLKDIDIEKDFLAVNGLNSYQDINWLKRKKQESIENGGGLSYIATEANCSTHTIRKWLKKYGLQFSKKEVASYTQVWNKGSPSIDQPMFGKKHSLKTRKLMQKSSRKGKDNNLYTGSERKWRMFVADECKKYKIELLEKQNYKCSLSGKPIKETTSEVDHIIPVSIRPDLAFDKNNLQILSKEEHLKKTNYEKKKYSETVKFAKIKSIKYIGEKQTYDLEVEKNHNYLGNGILVHNSQRYAEVKPEAIYREARLQDKKNRQNSINIDDEDLQKWWSDKQKDIWHEATSLYQAALDYGIAKEVARAVLPEGLTPSTLYVNGTIRSWIHYIDLRSANGTQKEHMEIARKCGKVISLVFPMIGGLNHVSTN